MKTSPTIDRIAPALLSAQEAVKDPKKTSWNPHFKSYYAGLDTVMEAAKEALNNYGIAVLQFPVHSDKGIGLETVLLHVSGQYISEVATTPLQKQDPQGVGSAITYLRRYGLCAALGIVADEDDDGNASAGEDRPDAVRAKTRLNPGSTQVFEKPVESDASTKEDW